MKEHNDMQTNELGKRVEEVLLQVPEEHRRRSFSAGVGAAIGGVVGSVIGGPIGAALGASIGGAVGVAVGEKSDSGGAQ